MLPNCTTHHNTKFVYSFVHKDCTNQTFNDHECTRNVHQILTCKQQNVQIIQNLHKLQTRKSLKLVIYLFRTYKQYTNYAETV